MEDTSLVEWTSWDHTTKKNNDCSSFWICRVDTGGGAYNGGLLVQVRLCLPPCQTCSCNLLVPTTTQSLVVVGKCPKLTGFLFFKIVFGHSFNWVEEKAEKYLVIIIIIIMYSFSARCFKTPTQSHQILTSILTKSSRLAQFSDQFSWVASPWPSQIEL